jgi:hypothetical protein
LVKPYWSWLESKTFIEADVDCCLTVFVNNTCHAYKRQDRRYSNYSNLYNQHLTFITDLFFNWVNFFQNITFLSCLYMYCRWRSSYHEVEGGIPLSGLTPSHVYACPKLDPGFPTSYVVVSFLCSIRWRWWNCWSSLFFVFNQVMLVELLIITAFCVQSGDVGGIVDHHCLDFLL